ncbi:hypothetical protein FMM05_19970 [Flavobacterium zepuense]|uniref:Uncharacterized protein n=1 Tax=Flavobacterium zepuense TaxID=2593302 RepID=A0A552UTH7_9FLAO|nr:hypothetical protein [Flavobacterium zepuense]TRW21536.1 hypothetical protein FMM05_19970 [Flavobacterium zepuense]
MKKSLILLLLSIATFQTALSQNKVFNSKHAKLDFTTEEIDLVLTQSSVKPGGNELAPVLLAAIPTVIDMGFKITTKILESKVKAFSAEYSKSNSYLDAGSGYVPNILLSRTVGFDNGSLKPALSIKFQPKKAKGTFMERYIYYYISDLELEYSSAKSTDSYPTFDYTIELKLNYIVGDEKKVLELAPIVLSSVKYGSNSFPVDKYRSDLIPLPENSVIVGASVKVVETNPGKVRAEKILSAWNDNKDDVKTIINNFLPKEDKEEAAAAPGAAPAAAIPAVNGDDQSSSNPKPAKKSTKKTP